MLDSDIFPKQQQFHCDTNQGNSVLVDGTGEQGEEEETHYFGQHGSNDGDLEDGCRDSEDKSGGESGEEPYETYLTNNQGDNYDPATDPFPPPLSSNAKMRLQGVSQKNDSNQLQRSNYSKESDAVGEGVNSDALVGSADADSVDITTEELQAMSEEMEVAFQKTAALLSMSADLFSTNCSSNGEEATVLRAFNRVWSSFSFFFSSCSCEQEGQSKSPDEENAAPTKLPVILRAVAALNAVLKSPIMNEKAKAEEIRRLLRGMYFQIDNFAVSRGRLSQWQQSREHGLAAASASHTADTESLRESLAALRSQSAQTGHGSLSDVFNGRSPRVLSRSELQTGHTVRDRGHAALYNALALVPASTSPRPRSQLVSRSSHFSHFSNFPEHAIAAKQKSGLQLFANYTSLHDNRKLTNLRLGVGPPSS